MRGYLQLTITRRTALTTITVSLAGRAWTTVQYTDGGGGGSSSAHCTARENRHLLQMEAPVAHFPSGVCDPGHFQCPFEFQLPLDVPSSMAEHKSQSRFVSGDNVARLDYCVGVVAARPGWKDPKLVHRVPIQILAPPPAYVVPTRVDVAVAVTRCSCIGAGSMRLGALMAQNAYRRPRGKSRGRLADRRSGSRQRRGCHVDSPKGQGSYYPRRARGRGRAARIVRSDGPRRLSASRPRRRRDPSMAPRRRRDAEPGVVAPRERRHRAGTRTGKTSRSTMPWPTTRPS